MRVGGGNMRVEDVCAVHSKRVLRGRLDMFVYSVLITTLWNLVPVSLDQT